MTLPDITNDKTSQMFLLAFLLVFRPSLSVLFGTVATEKDIHSSVSLLIVFSSELTVICGGVITPTGLILTARHCVTHEGLRAKRITVTVGELERKGSFLHKFNVDSVREVYQTGHEINDDLAMLTVPRDWCRALPQRAAKLPPTAFLPHQDEVPLSDEELEKALCWASGWGINEKNEFSRFPKTVQVRLRLQNFGYSSPVLLADYSDHARFCQGDSGSPVFCWLRGTRYVVGLLSEIGGDVVPSSKRNVTLADQCSIQSHVLLTDLRYKMAEIFQTRGCGH